MPTSARTAALAAVLLAGGLATPAAAQQIACYSEINSYYSGEPHNIVYYSDPVDLAEVARTLPPGQAAKTVVESRFTHWVMEAGQYGQWNAIWSKYIDCGEGIVAWAPGRGPGVRTPGTKTLDFRPAKLPPGWALKDPKQLASTGKAAAPVHGQVREARPALTVVPTESEAERQARLQREAQQKQADQVQAELRRRADALNAQVRAQVAKDVAEYNRRRAESKARLAQCRAEKRLACGATRQ